MPTPSRRDLPVYTPNDELDAVQQVLVLLWADILEAHLRDKYRRADEPRDETPAHAVEADAVSD